MARYYTVADVTNLYTGGCKHQEYEKTYARVLRGIYLGECGKVMRLGRGWALTLRNLDKLEAYLLRTWGMQPVRPPGGRGVSRCHTQSPA